MGCLDKLKEISETDGVQNDKRDKTCLLGQRKTRVGYRVRYVGQQDWLLHTKN